MQRIGSVSIVQLAMSCMDLSGEAVESVRQMEFKCGPRFLRMTTKMARKWRLFYSTHKGCSTAEAACTSARPFSPSARCFHRFNVTI